MCALTFVGLGLDEGGKGLTISAIEAIKSSDVVFLEVYTCPLDATVISKIRDLTGKVVEEVPRELVEDGRRILEESKKGKVSLLSPGDPMAATTHAELRVRAEERGVETRIIHNASALTSIPGEIGLHAYKLGKTVTLTSEADASMPVVYSSIHDNLMRGLHTIVLLVYDQSNKASIAPADALRLLIGAEEDFKQGILTSETFVVTASRVGMRHQTVKGGSIETLLGKSYGRPPHSLVIPGELHFTEKESLATLLKIDEEKIYGNSLKAKRLAVNMIRKYAPKTKIALEKARERVRGSSSKYSELFENVGLYTADAERFLNEGKDELAILSMGYAEGLLDSLRLSNVIDVDW